MSRHDGSEFGAAYWEDRYRNGGGASRRDPSPSLLAEAAGLPPGRALDAGCGWGADALWLASRGWHVTAVDVSPAALEQARQAADAAAPGAAARITWTPADLTSWDPGPTRFDLVTSHYVHVPGPAEALFARLASWVAPGGTLLVVGHGYTPGHHGGHHDHDEQPAAGARIRIAQITAACRTAGGTSSSPSPGPTPSPDRTARLPPAWTTSSYRPDAPEPSVRLGTQACLRPAPASLPALGLGGISWVSCSRRPGRR